MFGDKTDMEWAVFGEHFHTMKSRLSPERACGGGDVKPILEPAAALAAVVLRSQLLGGCQVEAVLGGFPLYDAPVVRLIDTFHGIRRECGTE